MMKRMDLSSLAVGKRYTRQELAELWGYQSPEAIRTGVVTPANEHVVILFVTRIKEKYQIQYNDYIEGEKLFWEGQNKHGSDARVVQSATNGDNVHLFYREMSRTPYEYKGKLLLVHHELFEDKPSKFVFCLLNDQQAGADFLEHESEFAGLNATEREAVIKSRIGQGVFRQQLLEKWHGCSVTGIYIPDILSASHIKPWRLSSNEERLDPENGLLLLPAYDKLFDKGLISFDGKGKVITSPLLKGYDLHELGINVKGCLRQMNIRMQEYLDFHRSNIFWSWSG